MKKITSIIIFPVCVSIAFSFKPFPFHLSEISNFDLIIGINVIDIYKDKSLGDGNKSLTVRMTYGSKERTLSGEEIDNCEKSFLTHLSKKIKFDIRD